MDVRCGNEGLITSNVATSISRAVLSCETRERGRSRVSDSDDGLIVSNTSKWSPSSALVELVGSNGGSVSFVPLE